MSQLKTWKLTERRKGPYWTTVNNDLSQYCPLRFTPAEGAQGVLHSDFQDQFVLIFFKLIFFQKFWIRRTNCRLYIFWIQWNFDLRKVSYCKFTYIRHFFQPFLLFRYKEESSYDEQKSSRQKKCLSFVLLSWLYQSYISFGLYCKHQFVTLFTKGQLISKCLFGVFKFFQKTKKST